MKSPLPEGLKQKEPPGLVMSVFRASYFLPFRFGFPSGGAFNLEEEEVVGVEEEGKRKRSCLPRIKFVPGSAGNRQRRAPRDLKPQQQRPQVQKLLPGARADTHWQTDPSLFPSRVPRPGSLAALHASAGRLCPSGESCVPRVRPAEGRGLSELGRVRGSGRVQPPRPQNAQPRSALRAQPRR